MTASDVREELLGKSLGFNDVPVRYDAQFGEFLPQRPPPSLPNGYLPPALSAAAVADAARSLVDEEPTDKELDAIFGEKKEEDENKKEKKVD
jgi:hypothetical protein